MKIFAWMIILSCLWPKMLGKVRISLVYPCLCSLHVITLMYIMRTHYKYIVYHPLKDYPGSDTSHYNMTFISIHAYCTTS